LKIVIGIYRTLSRESAFVDPKTDAGSPGQEPHHVVIVIRDKWILGRGAQWRDAFPNVFDMGITPLKVSVFLLVAFFWNIPWWATMLKMGQICQMADPKNIQLAGTQLDT
jgi:hypothetical protein